MQRAFNLLEHGADIVERDTRPLTPQIARFYREMRSGRLRARPGQSCTQGLVHDFLEWLACTSGFSLQPRGHVVIQCQCRSHIVMLGRRHHDVNVSPWCFAECEPLRGWLLRAIRRLTGVPAGRYIAS